MSNEELAERIQAGEKELVLQLWENVRNFVARMAINWSRGGRYETDDLIQCGFIAMVEAAEIYDPSGGASFIHFLAIYLKKHFRTGNGFRRRNQPDPLEDCVSLDEPLDDERDASTRLEITPDPRDLIEETEKRIWCEQLRDAVAEALGKLPEAERELLTGTFYRGETRAELAEKTGRTISQVQTGISHGLRTLRKNKALEQYVDFRTPFYMQVGVNEFLVTRTSAVEKTVQYREQLRRKLQKK